MGPRGHGKTYLLETCLLALRDKYQPQLPSNNNNNNNNNNNSSLFRVVRLNGLFIRGHDVTLAVREILRQLSEIAAGEASTIINHPLPSTPSTPSTSTNRFSPKQQQQQQHDDDDDDVMASTNTSKNKWKLDESYLLRTRQTSFISSLSLLDEVFRLANVDGIPILIILDEIDSFMSATTTTTTVTITTNTIICL